MNYIYIFIWAYIVLSISLCIFTLLVDKKLKKLEMKNKNLFKKRTNLIPCLYEITKKSISKSSNVFNEALKLRKQEYINSKEDISLREFIYHEGFIHHELNFIFKIILKNKDLNKKGNLLYIRDLVINQSEELANSLDLYKSISKKINKLILYKNLTIIWLFFPIDKKDV